jgi:membrane protease YdiL (CAAX protease family)
LAIFIYEEYIRGLSFLGMPDMKKALTVHKSTYTFLALATVFASLSYLLAFNGDEGNIPGGLLLVQFSPAAAAIITKLVYDRTIRGLGWGWGKTRYQLASYALPFVLASIGFGLIWLLGFGGFYNSDFMLEAQNGLSEKLGLDVASPYIIMLVLVLVNSTIGLFASFGSLGEEIGWRGFLVPELYKHFSYTKTSAISGVIWVTYHIPVLVYLIAPRLEAHVLPILIFTFIGGIGISFILAWLRIKSGSLWTAVIFHSALNIHLQSFFMNLTTETSKLTRYISGEQGLMMAIVMAVAGYLFWRNRSSLD